MSGNYFDFDFRLIVPLSIETHGLVNQQRVVHGDDEEFLSSCESLALGCPNMKSYPRL